jgi:hypothetical protein
MMNDAQAPRRAYFASLSTPDLIVCATVERGRYEESDLALIHQELVKRGVNPEKLAIPMAPFGPILGITPAAFSGPLPWAWSWWGESWQLFSRHFNFLAAMAAVFTLPLWFFQRALANTHDRDLSVGLVAHVLFLVAFDSLLAASVFNGLHRRMSQGRGSVGSAVANGMQSWGRVFRESLKAYGLALGVPLLLYAAGQSNDSVGFKVWAWILLAYPGSYLFIRVFWVQAIAICKSDEPHVFPLSRRYSRGRVLQLYWFLQVALVVTILQAIVISIVKAILPKPLLEPAAVYFIGTMAWILSKTTLLVGYYHVSAAAAGIGCAVSDTGLMGPVPI